MNYMKILLIYMAATMSLAVQSTTAPVETPVPTPAPALEQQAQAEGTDPSVPIIGVEVVQTSAPSETPPPVPEITPNKKYHNLKKGDKGSDVKALQKRLIELGYLPEGSADGNYGNQTYRAVRNFQYYNGLTRDGIAGRRTQTYLFENPDVNPYPTETPAPEETETPAPEEAETPAPAETTEAGIYALSTDGGRQVFITGHPEYDTATLQGEYQRDRDAGLPIRLPRHYYPQDDASKDPICRWRSSANLLFANWLNYFVYQTTPYDLSMIPQGVSTEISE